jgi:hypothetical protein
MGEAYLRYARNEKQDAINLCMEVIRQVNSFEILICVNVNFHCGSNYLLGSKFCRTFSNIEHLL